MKKLYDLSIKRKFLLIVFPLIIIIGLLDFFQLRYSYLDYDDSVRVNKAIQLVNDINHLIHELQKERSITAAWMTGEKDDFFTSLMVQRTQVDNAKALLDKEFRQSEYSEIVNNHFDKINELKNRLNAMINFRQLIIDEQIEPLDVVDFFTELNEMALQTVNEITDDSRDKDITQQVHGIIYFLKAKELASIERSIGIILFNGDTIDNAVLRQFTNMEAAQESYIDAFLSLANAESAEYYHQIMIEENIEEVDRLRSLLYNNQADEIDPQHWYEIKTRKINSMKKVETHMENEIFTLTSNVANKSTREFILFVVVDLIIGVTVLIVLTLMVSNIIKNISFLDMFAKKVAGGNYKEHVSIETKDELGQYATTFNMMIDEIHRSHNGLRIAKNRADSILAQYQTVFANVEQGIFLLDKDLKISRPYSKAMRDIFDVEAISHEPFSNFMRPRIIPKDHEALEMFMRHLYNPEMSDDILDEINPIKHVKIFNETKGNYNTKYIEVKFSRIMKQDRIVSIMVTITNVTNAVLIQKKLKEVEERKKRETDQILSVLKVNPYMLKKFLHNTRKVLGGISGQFEKHQGYDYRKLISFANNVFEDLKGTTQVIGMMLVHEKLISAQEALKSLNAVDVKTKDFLSVLYKVNEIDKILLSMTELLEQVTETYVSLGPKELIKSNLFIIELIEQKISEFAKETGKEALFNFSNDKNIAIPNKYSKPLEQILNELINNSLQHGIEESKERLERNKPSLGMIVLSIDVNDEKNMLLSFRDDGRGLNPFGIKEKALAKGIISDNEADLMSDDRVGRILFLDSYNDSFSNDTVLHGLPLVRSIVEELGGIYEVNFAKDRFTEIKIILPLVTSNKPKLIPEDILIRS